MMPIGKCRTRTWKRPTKKMKSCMPHAPSSLGFEGAYDISSERGCEPRLSTRSLKTSKREPLVEARLERIELARPAAKADITVGPQQQQAVIVARAITCGQRGARRDDAQLEDGGEAVHERFQASLQRSLPFLARRQREQCARRMARQAEQRAAPP